MKAATITTRARDHTCQQCGGAWVGRKKKFCSRRCGQAFRPRSNTKPHSLICQHCGQAYSARFGKQKYCSRDCLYKASRTRPERICVVCGVGFRQVRADDAGKCCSRKCGFEWLGVEALVAREVAALRRIRGNWQTETKTRFCKICGKPFKALRLLHYQCGGKACANEHKRAGKRKTFVPVPLRDNACTVCGGQFWGHGGRLLCDVCLPTRQRVVRGKTSERFKRREIFQRDGWRCQLCGKKVSLRHRAAHQLYPNLDHIIPITRGGQHTRVNTQCLCRRCNIKKGAKLGGVQLRLIG